MRVTKKLITITVLLLCGLAGSTRSAVAQNRDPLLSLKRVVNEASAPLLTGEQEAQLNDLITNYRKARPDDPDDMLEAARTAWESAILAGDLAAAKAQAAIIASRTAELTNSRLQADTKFRTDVLGVLKNGGQFEPLRQKLGDDRLLGLIGSLGGHSPGEGHPAFGLGFAPPERAL